MGDENLVEGQNCYSTASPKVKAWFQRQWSIWPKRADERFKTNLSFHYGAVLGFRAEHGRDPDMSPDFREHVQWQDRNFA